MTPEPTIKEQREAARIARESAQAATRASRATAAAAWIGMVTGVLGTGLAMFRAPIELGKVQAETSNKTSEAAERQIEILKTKYHERKAAIEDLLTTSPESERAVLKEALRTMTEQYLRDLDSALGIHVSVQLFDALLEASDTRTVDSADHTVVPTDGIAAGAGADIANRAPADIADPILSNNPLAKWLAAWAAETQHQFTVVPGPAVALLAATSQSTGQRQGRIALIERTIKEFDTLAPIPVGRSDADRRAKDKPHPTLTWGNGHTPEFGTILLLEVGREDAYDGIRHTLLSANRLDGFLGLRDRAYQVDLSDTGFINSQFLVGLWTASAFLCGSEAQLDTDHLAVNCLGQLLTYRRFGLQPEWLTKGLAWELERRVLGSIYLDTDGDGIPELTTEYQWESSLLQELQQHGGVHAPDLFVDNWRLGGPQTAWTFITYLADTHPGRIGAIAESLRLFGAMHPEEVDPARRLDGRAARRFPWDIVEGRMDRVGGKELWSTFLESIHK